MDCCQVAKQGLAELYVKGTLQPSLQDELELHFIQCKECFHNLELLHDLQLALRSLPLSIIRTKI
jgi:hypothetical protein